MRYKKIKHFILDIISFGSPQAIVLNISSIFFILALTPTKLTAYSPFKCIFKHFLLPLVFNGNCPSDGIFANCECPACGMTRGMSRLLHGDFEGAYSFNRMVFVLFFFMVLVLIVNIIKTIRFFRKNRKIY